METQFFSYGSKHGMKFPIVSFQSLVSSDTYNKILEVFYEQNIYGFDFNDITEKRNITILEFDFDDIPEPPFLDTRPKEVEKELLKDYLIPLVGIITSRMIDNIIIQYSNKQDYGDSAILNLKERLQDEINQLIIMFKEARHLTSGLKKPVLDSLNQVLDYIKKNVNTNFADDFSLHKIKFKMRAKEVYHLMVFLNEKGFFYEKLEASELAKLVEMHFQFQVSGNDYSNFKNAEQSLSNSVNSAIHNSLSDRLNSILKDYPAVIKNAESKKK